VNHEARKQHLSDWRERLQDAIDRLDERRSDFKPPVSKAEGELRAHLDDCDLCRKEYARLAALHARLKEEFANVPPLHADFSARIFARIDAQEQTRRTAAKQRAEQEFRRRVRAVTLDWRDLWQQHTGNLVAALAVIVALAATFGSAWESVRERLLVALDVVQGAHSVVALPVLLVAASGGVAALALWWLAPKKSAHSLVD